MGSWSVTQAVAVVTGFVVLIILCDFRISEQFLKQMNRFDDNNHFIDE